MTFVPPTIPYASPAMGNCPLCNIRPLSSKRIYDHPVCKKCFYKFANRRQLGYLIDALVFIIPNVIIILTLQFAMRSSIPQAVATAIAFVVGLGLACLFCLRDSIDGRSPGKRATGLQVINETDHQPISYGQSFKRNAILLLGNIPVVGPLIGLVLIITLAVQVGRGYRLGDKWAKTRVIWTKYADLSVFGGDALVCIQCGYNLKGNTSGICPECGKTIPAATAASLQATG